MVLVSLGTLYPELSNGRAALAQAALYYRSRDQTPDQRDAFDLGIDVDAVR